MHRNISSKFSQFPGSFLFRILTIFCLSATLHAAPLNPPKTDKPFEFSLSGFSKDIPEPYTLYRDGQFVKHGLTDKAGKGYIKNYIKTSCYVILLSNDQRLKVNPKGKECNEYKLPIDIEDDAATKAKKETDKLREEEMQNDYKKQAAANDDELAWLGKLPPIWSSEVFEERTSKLFEKMGIDMDVGTIDLNQFACKNPAQIGDIPDMDAVNEFLEATIATLSDPHSKKGKYYAKNINTIWRNLVSAAAKGNWLARVQIYRLLGRKHHDKMSYLERYRLLQVTEWLQEKKIGSLYGLFGVALEATGFSDNGFLDRFSAMKGSYGSQYVLGTSLLSDPDPKLQETGKRMINCARSALPAFAKLYKPAPK
ncbi:hypothetical protein QN379_11115 [Glaciimonas sp. Gout2]|uniref:hypothetical protein n=2 Tax=Glaciimonas TaxID=1229970 RepID=UPI002B22A5D1|nr:MULTISPECIES: hypothetical protein [unclassified Glaciimonas]MEB0012508.1 hypothetical protein [Glaciimonas sp. Cout2]MEB0082563.1 hypothetical protein [Glaciimonas sp. Gout2]